MLKITIPETEFYDSSTNSFFTVAKQTLLLEHSLISLSKWEQKWHIRFLDDSITKTREQIVDYIRCMTVNSEPDPSVYSVIANNETIIKQIKDYIQNPMTATTIYDLRNELKKSKKEKKENLSAEVLYYMMFSRGIPIECSKWHLNTLISLLKVYDFYNEQNVNKAKGKNGTRKLNSEELADRNAINEARRKALKTNG